MTGEHAPEPFSMDPSGAGALRDAPVVDAHGQRVGRVLACAFREGRLAGCDVRFDRALAREMGIDRRVGRVAAEWIEDASSERVRLSTGAQHILLLLEREPEEVAALWEARASGRKAFSSPGGMPRSDRHDDDDVREPSG